MSASVFHAINAYEEDIQDNEERTREIQAEEAFRVYEQALNIHKSGDIPGAFKIYQELFGIEIFHNTDDTLIPITPNISRLMYLAYKGYGSLLLDRLKGYEFPLDIDRLNQIKEVLLYFGKALAYDPSDTTFWFQVAQLSATIDNTRVQRLALDAVIDNPSRLVPVYKAALKGEFLSAHEASSLVDLKKLLDSIQDEFCSKNELFPRLASANVRPFPGQVDWIKQLHVGINGQPTSSKATESINSRKIILGYLRNNCFVDLLELLLNWDIETLKQTDDWSCGMIRIEEGTGESVPKPIPLHDRLIEAGPSSSIPDQPLAENDTPKDPEEQIKPSLEMKRSLTADLEESMRSSKRSKSGQQDSRPVTSTVEWEDENFFHVMADIFATVNIEFSSISHIFNKNLTSATAESDRHLRTFNAILYNWADSVDDFSTIADQPLVPEISGDLLPKLTQTKCIESFNTGLKIDFEEDKVRTLVKYINSGAMSIQEAKVIVVYNLTGPESLFFQQPLGKRVVEQLLRLVADCELECYGTINYHLTTTTRDTVDTLFADLRWAQAILELLIDCHTQKQAASQDTGGNGEDDLQEEENDEGLSMEIQQWSTLVSSLLSQISQDSGVSREQWNYWNVRYLWTKAVSSEYISFFDSTEVLNSLENLKDLVISIDKDLIIPFPNSASIPTFSVATCSSQMSKVQVASLLERVFQVNHHLGFEQPNDRLQTLELLLGLSEQNSGWDMLEDGSLDNIRAFMTGSSSEFQILLWSLLKEEYQKREDWAGTMLCLLRILEITSTEITKVDSFDSETASKHNRLVVLGLERSHEIVHEMLEIMPKDEALAKLGREEVQEAMASLIEIIRLLQVYALFDDAVSKAKISPPTDDTYVNLSSKWKDLLVRSWCAEYFLFRYLRRDYDKSAQSAGEEERRPVEPDLELFLGMVHEELGPRAYCGRLDRYFLRLMSKELLEFNLPHTEADLLQCLHCRYDLGLGVDDFYPFDHHTAAEELDRDSAIGLVSFVMQLALKKRSAKMQMPRSDMKTVLDQLCGIIGVPQREAFAISHNYSVLDRYFAQPLDLDTIMRESFSGNLSLQTMPAVDVDSADVARQGLYLLQGQTFLTSYKLRKKTHSGRSEDLDYAIRYFQYDVVCATDKFESWYGMAEAYQLKVEDDLTWSAEKLNNNEQKAQTANLQKRCILCYAIALSLCLCGEGAGANSNILAAFWRRFAEQLINAVSQPMNCACIEVGSLTKLKLLPTGQVDVIEHEGGGKKNLRLAATKRRAFSRAYDLLKLSEREDCQKWMTFYLLGHVSNKLHEDPRKVLNYYQQAITSSHSAGGGTGNGNAGGSSNNSREKAGAATAVAGGQHSSSASISATKSHELVLEPHYRLMATTYKYATESKISVWEANEILLHSSFYSTAYREKMGDGGNIEPKDKGNLAEYVCGGLGKLMASDKKKWHHRPIYRISKIMYDNGDVEGAIEQFTSLFSLKPNSKGLISIWRPEETERAGKHFVYCHDYVEFMLKMLERVGDIETIGILGRKLRRLGSSMIEHSELWDEYVTSAVHVIRKLAGIPCHYVDAAIAFTASEDFAILSQALERILKLVLSRGDNKELNKIPKTSPIFLELLYEVSELRKLNNGLAPSTDLDDVYASLYMKLYFDVPKLAEAAQERIAAASEQDGGGGGEKKEVFLCSDSGTTVVSRLKNLRPTRKDVISRANALVKLKLESSTNCGNQQPPTILSSRPGGYRSYNAPSFSAAITRARFSVNDKGNNVIVRHHHNSDYSKDNDDDGDAQTQTTPTAPDNNNDDNSKDFTTPPVRQEQDTAATLQDNNHDEESDETIIDETIKRSAER